MNRRAIVVVIMFGSAVVVPHRAAAQDAASGASVVVTPGSRVRVTAPATGRIVGTLLMRATTACGSSSQEGHPSVCRGRACPRSR
jgi:hypothetical protein